MRSNPLQQLILALCCVATLVHCRMLAGYDPASKDQGVEQQRPQLDGSKPRDAGPDQGKSGGDGPPADSRVADARADDGADAVVDAGCEFGFGWKTPVGPTAFWGGDDHPKDYDEGGWALAVGDDGSVYLAGQVEGSLSFAAAQTSGTAGYYNMVVVRLAADGRPVWKQVFGAQGHVAAHALAVKGDTVYVGGTTGPSTKFGVQAPSALVLGLHADNGERAWVTPLETQTADVTAMVEGIAVVGSRVFVTGVYEEKLIGAGDQCSSSNGEGDIFVARLIDNGVDRGKLDWLKCFGSAKWDSGMAIAADADDNVIVVGYHNDEMTAGGKPVSHAAREDAFVIRFDHQGNAGWALNGGSAGMDRAEDVIIDGDKAVITGWYAGEFKLGGLPWKDSQETAAFLAEMRLRDGVVTNSRQIASHVGGGTQGHAVVKLGSGYAVAGLTERMGDNAKPFVWVPPDQAFSAGAPSGFGSYEALAFRPGCPAQLWITGRTTAPIPCNGGVATQKTADGVATTDGFVCRYDLNPL